VLQLQELRACTARRCDGISDTAVWKSDATRPAAQPEADSLRARRTPVPQWNFGLAAYRRQLVFYRRLSGAPSGGWSPPAGFEFRFVRPEELEALHYPGGWLTLPDARRWLERGDSDMLASIRDGRICSYLWVERRLARIDFLDVEAPLPAGHIYISKVLVTPGWRRHGLAESMYRFVAALEPEAAAHSACVVKNAPMHALFSKLYWERRLKITSWRVAGLRWHTIESSAGGRTGRFLSACKAASLLFS